MVYPRISLDIPSFLNPDFSSGLSCWSQSIRTRLWVIKSVLLHATPWQLCQGKRWPTKAHFFCFFPGPAALPFALLAAGLAAAAPSAPGSDVSSSSSSTPPPPPPLPSPLPSPPSPPPPPPSPAAAAAAAVARASCLAASRSRTSCLVSDSRMGLTVQDLQDW